MIKVYLKKDVFKNYLKKKNITFYDFSAKIEISPAIISDIMNGRREPSKRLRKKMLDEMAGYEFDDLFYFFKE